MRKTLLAFTLLSLSVSTAAFAQGMMACPRSAESSTDGHDPEKSSFGAAGPSR